MRTAGAGRAAEEREQVDVAVRLVRAVPRALALREEQGARVGCSGGAGDDGGGADAAVDDLGPVDLGDAEEDGGVAGRLGDAARRPRVVLGRAHLVVGDLASRERHERCRRGPRRVEGFVEAVVAGDVVRAGVGAIRGPVGGRPVEQGVAEPPEDLATDLGRVAAVTADHLRGLTEHAEVVRGETRWCGGGRARGGRGGPGGRDVSISGNQSSVGTIGSGSRLCRPRSVRDAHEGADECDRTHDLASHRSPPPARGDSNCQATSPLPPSASAAGDRLLAVEVPRPLPNVGNTLGDLAGHRGIEDVGLPDLAVLPGEPDVGAARVVGDSPDLPDAIRLCGERLAEQLPALGIPQAQLAGPRWS